MRADLRSARALLIGALAAALIVAAGVLTGQLAWGTLATARLAPASGGVFGRLGYERPIGFRVAEAESAGAGPAAGGVAGSIVGKVDPGLVDINTELGLEGGAAAGTGMVVTANGEVITNNHVIAGATSITATDVGNGTTYKARVLGYDKSADVAVLQLEGASGLQTVSFGNSGSLAVGESVATIGNAGGLGGTPTARNGRVSALDQSITASDAADGGEEHLSGLVELEGDVQAGDSGGPLVTSAGEVLGMDTAASSSFDFRSATDQGYAIPINTVKSVAAQILAGGASSAVHIGASALLGVYVSSTGSEGALVEGLLVGTPVASSGLREGDTITGLDGTAVGSGSALTALMAERHPGEAVTLTWRTPAGVQQGATVRLASGPPQ